MGYIFIGLSCMSILGYISVLYYIVIYIISLSSIFSILIVLRNINKKGEIKNIVEFSSIAD